MQTYILDLSPFPGIKFVLQTLKEQKITLVILTSNTLENVEKFLALDALEVFDLYYTGSSLLGKARHLNQLTQQGQLKKKRFYYVGDETRDITASGEAEINAIAVT